MEPKAYLAKCSECPLADQPCVPGDPDTTTEFDVIVVGEAPGVEEEREGRPFVGRSGQLLKKVLEYNNIDPIEVYYTNAVLCHPPMPGGKQEPPNAKALKACRERLLHELNERKPKFVIALGAKAAQTLLSTRDGITALRKGRPHETKDVPGAKIIPTFHTAAALRDPDHFPSIVSDIDKMHRIEVGWEPTKFVAANESNARALLRDQLDHSDLFAADIELDKPFLRHEPHLLCLGVSHRPGHAVVYPVEVIDRVKDIFNEGFKDKAWAWQNGKFDIQYLWSLGMTNAKVDEDTMLAHYATDERKGTHDLEQIATEIIGAPFWKEEARSAIKEEDTLGFLPKDKLYQYNATDADVTYRLLRPLEKEMKKDGTYEMYRTLLIPGSEALAHMEYRGVRVNLDRLEEVSEFSEEETERLEEPTKKWVQNPRSPQQNLKVLHELGFRVPDTAEDTIKDIDHPFVKALLAYRHSHKMLSTYVRGLPKWMYRDRVHPTFYLHTTETGRTSCRKPNLQNYPVDHPIRECFVPTEGHEFIEADYAGIELRVLATVSGDLNMRQAFIDGRNLHKEQANRLFGPDHTERQYITTKSINFGTPYMEKAKHLAFRLGIPVYQAKKIQDEFFARFPRVKDYHRDTMEQIRTNQYLSSLYGRKRRFWLLTRDNAYDTYKEGVNFRIQSAASDIMLSALIKIHNEKPYLRPVVNVHDSLIFDVPIEHGEEAMREVTKMMESVNPLDVPLVAEAERSDRWKMK